MKHPFTATASGSDPVAKYYNHPEFTAHPSGWARITLLDDAKLYVRWPREHTWVDSTVFRVRSKTIQVWLRSPRTDFGIRDLVRVAHLPHTTIGFPERLLEVTFEWTKEQIEAALVLLELQK